MRGEKNPDNTRVGHNEDHPRVRGEKIDGQNGVDTLEGSPPRARGED